jgi:hypothetical protein
LSVLIICGATAAPIPERAAGVISKYCLDCHDTETAKGDIVLEHDTVDWASVESRELWERALHAVESGQMPPKK